MQGCTKSQSIAKTESTAREGGETEIQHPQHCHNCSWGAIRYFQMNTPNNFLPLLLVYVVWPHICAYTPVFISNIRFYHPFYHYSQSACQNFWTPCLVRKSADSAPPDNFNWLRAKQSRQISAHLFGGYCYILSLTLYCITSFKDSIYQDGWVNTSAFYHFG